MKIPIPTKEEIDRFWSGVHKKGPDECWIYKKSLKWYAKIRIQGIAVYAHRLVAFLKYGAIPVGMFACHTCDNPPCVNPNHLFLGSREDNMKDASAKRRIGIHVKPEQYDFLKCNDDMVVKIRAATGSQNQIAKLFGLSQSHVCRIRSGKSWK